MGKMLPMLLLVVAIELSLVMFIGGDLPGSSLWDLISNPQNWGELSFVDLFSDAVGLAAISGIIVGTFWTKSDFLVFASITGVFLSFGVSVSKVFTQLNSQTVFTSSQSWLAIIIVAPMIISYLYVCLKFWRGSD